MSTVKPIKQLPEKLSVSGDYRQTAAALFLGAVSRDGARLNKYNRSADTFRAITFLQDYGYRIERNSEEIKIYPGRTGINFEGEFLELDTGPYPLALAMGLLLGQAYVGALRFHESVNADFLDKAVNLLNSHGIDISLESEERILVFRGSSISALEVSLSSTIPHYKDLLLMMALGAGQRVILKEKKISGNILEQLMEKMGGRKEVREFKPRLVTDPRDPRKKVLETVSEFKREIALAHGTIVPGGDIEITSDNHAVLALILLAALKRQNLVIPNVGLNEKMRNFIKVAEASGLKISRRGGHALEGDRLVDLEIKGCDLKGRKLSGEMAEGLLEETPFLAVMLSAADGTSVFRDIREYVDIAVNPLGEIVRHLENNGIKAGGLDDGLILEGNPSQEPADMEPFQNPDIALAFYMAALAGHAKSEFPSLDLIRSRYPDFLENVQEAAEREILIRTRS